ncbi:MAG: trigger factor [Deltaproteobacteria bacterium]|nr:trigger factor [Deltaproteobacteria bacterium]
MHPESKLEEVSPIKRRLVVDVPVERVVTVLEASYQKVQQHAKLKGFREGKVPRPMVEQYFRREVEAETMEALVRESFSQALERTQQRALGQPEIVVGPFAKDRPFTYTATFEVRPKVEVKTYRKLALTRPLVVVNEAEVEAQLQRFREMLTQLVPVDDGVGAAVGMVATIDYEGTADGKPFEGSSAKDFAVEFGANQLLAEFEQQLLGMRVSEERTAVFHYPDDYFNVSLAGSEAKFHVALKELKRKIVPELTDDFAKDLGPYENLDAVRAEVRTRLTEQHQQEARGALAQQAVQQLIEHHPFEVPEIMVGWELSQMFHQFERRLQHEGTTWQQVGMTPEQFVEQYAAPARDRVRSQLILEAIAEVEGLVVSDAELEARLKAISESVREELDKVRRLYTEKNMFPALKNELLQEKCLDFIIGEATIKDGQIEDVAAK